VGIKMHWLKMILDENQEKQAISTGKVAVHTKARPFPSEVTHEMHWEAPISCTLNRLNGIHSFMVQICIVWASTLIQSQDVMIPTTSAIAPLIRMRALV